MESFMLFLTMSLALDMDVQIGDLKNAFCQSDPLVRPRGRVFVKPCEGLSLPPGSLIELIAPVYGLDDALLALHRAAASFFESRGYVKSKLEPCWMTKRGPRGPEPMVLIEVGDWRMAHVLSVQAEELKCCRERFDFGKMVRLDASG
eukprot:5149254-Pyramimonas_sp.AAC.1